MVTKVGGNGARPLMESYAELQRSLAEVSADARPETFLARALELIRLAPSDSYFQPWRWIVVRSEHGKQQLEAATYSETSLFLSPIVLVCLADTAAWKTTPQQLQEMVAAKVISAEDARNLLNQIRRYYSASPQLAERAALANAFLAVHQILVAATCCDVPTQWVTVFDEKKIQTCLHIPDHFLVAALLAIGDAGKASSPALRLPAQPFVYQEKFGQELAGR
jgi:nitroreductase